MARVQKLTFRPQPESREVYDQLFAEYHTLHDYFGRGANDVMKRLKAIREVVSRQLSVVSRRRKKREFEAVLTPSD